MSVLVWNYCTQILVRAFALCQYLDVMYTDISKRIWMVSVLGSIGHRYKLEDLCGVTNWKNRTQIFVTPSVWRQYMEELYTDISNTI